MWQEILTSILTSSLITGIFVAILNKAIENKFDMKLEAYKDKLKFESDKELTSLTNKLEIMAKEREIQFGGVFPSQREVIENVYAKLIALNEALISFGLSLTTSTADEKYNVLNAILKEFQSYYYPKAIYLPDKTVKNIHNLNIDIQKSIWNYRRIAELEQRPNTPVSINKLYDDNPTREANIEKSMAIVVKDFQTILGIKDIVLDEKTKTA